MSTSSRNVFFEAVTAAVLTAVAVALWSPEDVWLSRLGFHPAWIAVLVLAAHYGSLGLFLALGLTLASLTGASYILGGSIDGLQARTGNTSDMFALAASLAVAWLAMLQERKVARLNQHLAAAERNHTQANEALAAFHEHIAPLRARYDRIDLSVTMWRDLASRIESGDVVQAARAALDLGGIRSGASAGVVYFCEGNGLGVLERFGHESALESLNIGIAIDRTAHAAVDRHHAVLAFDIDGPTEGDSDVAAPILDDNGGVLGVIALRGVSANRLSSADIHDLSVIAQWLAPALARSRSWRRGAHTSTAEAATQ